MIDVVQLVFWCLAAMVLMVAAWWVTLGRKR